mgnify:FL=1
MKKCKFCNAELPDGSTVCPSCGKDNAAESGSKAAKPGSAALIIVGVLALVILAIGAFFTAKEGTTYAAEDGVVAASEEATEATAEEATEEATEAPTEAPTVPADGNPDDVTCKGSYTAEDEAVVSAREKVVATAGEYELTLGQLQVYYWMEFRNFMSQYGTYASYFGLDVSQPLDTQMCSGLEEARTWQQFFLEGALNSWNNYRAMAAEADANGFELTEQQRAAIDNAAAELEEAAAANGFESGIAMLHSSLGAGAELEDYVYFMELYYKANGYYAQIAQGFEPTDEQLDDYFEEHAEGYAASGITKDTKLVNVRHILVYPEGADGTNLATQEFSEEAWAASEKKAQEILDQFLAGDKTEESFAALANEYSEDPGSNTNGGLYENVSEGEMVAAFNDWCFDAARQVGDTGIVKTNYGYHVMYFSGSQTTWQKYARNDYMVENATATAKEIAAKLPMTVQYSDILLANSVIQ